MESKYLKDEVVEGYTLYDALESARPPKRFPDKPVRSYWYL